MSLGQRHSFLTHSVVGNMYSVHTTGDNTHSTFSIRPKHKSIVFRVRACHSATVRLGIGSDWKYELQLGIRNNQQSAICELKTGDVAGNVTIASETPLVLDCTAYRTFWASWYGGVIHVGRGDTPETHRFMHLLGVQQAGFDTVALATSQGSDGDWEVDELQGTHISPCDSKSQSLRRTSMMYSNLIF